MKCFWNEYKNKVKELKNEVVVAYRDPRVSVWAKLLVGLVVGYALSPVDLIPDFIPVLVLLDDLLLAPFGIYWCIKLIPADVLAEARVKAGEIGTEKPVKAAVVIVGVWVAVLVWMGFKFIRVFRIM